MKSFFALLWENLLDPTLILLMAAALVRNCCLECAAPLSCVKNIQQLAYNKCRTSPMREKSRPRCRPALSFLTSGSVRIWLNQLVLIIPMFTCPLQGTDICAISIFIVMEHVQVVKAFAYSPDSNLIGQVSTVLGFAIKSQREEAAWTEGIAIWVAVGVVSMVGKLGGLCVCNTSFCTCLSLSQPQSLATCARYNSPIELIRMHAASFFA